MSVIDPRIVIFDDFLAEHLLGKIEDRALASEDQFVPSAIDAGTDGTGSVNREVRNSSKLESGLDALEDPFVREILNRKQELCVALGMPDFKVSECEVDLLAYCDGGFYRRHCDPYTREARESSYSDRVISTVFYFHRLPKAFSGGELAIFGFGSDRVVELVEPVRNRLVAFPSFVFHEIRKVRCPSGNFADSRFSINCWLHRARIATASAMQ